MEGYIVVITAFCGLLTAACTLAIAVATIRYVNLTKTLVAESQKNREIETEPKIVTYCSFSETVIDGIDLIVINLGKGPALNSKIEITCDNEPIESKGIKMHGLRSLENIEVLLRFEKLSIYLLPKSEFVKLLETSNVIINIKYKDLFGHYKSTKHELARYEFTDPLIIRPNYIQEIVASIKDISRMMKDTFPEKRFVESIALSIKSIENSLERLKAYTSSSSRRMW